MLGAIPWNLTRLDDLRRKRRQLRRVRTVGDREIAQRQMGGSARLSAFSRGQFSAGQDRFSLMWGSVRSSFRGDDSGNVRDATVIGVILAVLLLFGSRHLLTRGVAPVGEIPDVPGSLTLLREWLSGWRTVGTGGPGNAPTALVMLGLLRALFFWAPGLFDTLLVVGPVFLGPIGVYRLARPLASSRAGAIGALVYACNPVTVSALSAGRWEALVVVAAAPFVLAALLRVGGYRPFGSIGGQAGPSVADRNLPVRLLRFGFLIAAVGALAPAIVPVAVVMALLLALSAAILGQGGNPAEVAGAAGVAIVAPVALHAPWSFDLLRGLSWSWIVGPRSPETGYDSLLELLQFAPGAPPARLATLGLVAGAALAFAVARTDLLHLVVSGWILAVAFLGLAWADRRDWIPIELPTAEILLAPVAVGFTLAVMVGVRSLESRLVGVEKRPRLPRLAALGGGLAVLAMGFTGLLSSLSGVWEAPTQSFSSSTTLLVRQQQSEETNATPGRILWIGDPSVLPLDPFTTETGIHYAVSDGGRPDVRGRWLTSPVGVTDGIGAQLDLAKDGEVVRLGRLLAPYGVDNVVVVSQLAPAPYDGPTVDPGEGVVRALSQQLDLERVPGVLNLIVFRNVSSNGLAPVLPNPEAAQAQTPVDQLDVNLAQESTFILNNRPGQWVVAMPEDAEVLVAIDGQGLRASGARTEVSSGFDELAVLPAGPSGEVILEYGPRLRRQLGLVAQVLLVAVGAILAQTRREAAR